MDNNLKEIFPVCILWLDCKQSTQKKSEHTLLLTRVKPHDPDSDLRGGFFYLSLTPMIDPYIIQHVNWQTVPSVFYVPAGALIPSVEYTCKDLSLV